MAGAPFAGVGAVPGALAGATAGALASAVADPIVAGVNSLLGTQYQMPTDALSDLLTRIGVPEAKTEAERSYRRFLGLQGQVRLAWQVVVCYKRRLKPQWLVRSADSLRRNPERR